ncbi:hypothetical protein GOV12_02975 [Candidatus Pacearchaeota archaeon]|nr:hypothetical protein [Candidatus Pacearchaeota archaeon]
MQENIYVHLYTQNPGGNEGYVMGVVGGPATNETSRRSIEELVPEVMDMAPKGFQGKLPPVRWGSPKHLINVWPPKGIIPKEKRKDFADALPEGVTVNLR